MKTREEASKRPDHIPPGHWEIPAGTKASDCRSCKAPIFWIKTPKGKNMPVSCDTELGQAPTAVEFGVGIAHFSNCPNADDHRRR